MRCNGTIGAVAQISKMHLRFRPLPVLSVFTILALGLLIWLGAWQWQRFHTKIAARAVVPQIVSIAEVPDITKAVFVSGVQDGRQGWRVFAPLAVADQTTAFVDLAFWPNIEPPRNTFCFLREEVRGVWVTPRKASTFRAKDNPQARLFYSVQLAEMAKSVGLGSIEGRYLAADYGPQPNPFVRNTEALPPERHLGYAVTWWGLAVGLIGIYLAFHAGRGRFSVALSPKRQKNGQV